MRGFVFGLIISTTFCFGYTILSEDFNSAWDPENPPTGWSIFHTSSDTWTTADWHRVDSGGAPWLQHISHYAAILWNLYADPPPDSLVTPMIDCSGYQNITLRCSTYFLRKLPGSYTAQIRYSTDGGVTFPHLIRDYWNDSVPPTEEVFNLGSARNQPNVVIAWIYNGNLSDINWWCLDDVFIEGDSILDYDIACTSIQDPGGYIMPGDLTPRARFSNSGLQDQVNVAVACSLYDNLGTWLANWYDTIPALNAGQTQSWSFTPPYTFLTTGNDFYIRFWSETDADSNRSNDTLDRTFDVTWLQERRYDNGSAAAFDNWPVGHYGWGVKFTLTDSVYLESAKVYLRCPVNPAHCMYQLAVVRTNPAGEPGEMYFKTPVLFGANGTSSWHSVFLADTGEHLVFPPDSSFYIFYLQVGEPPECPAIGRDGARSSTAEYWQYRSGVYRPDSANGDYMIRVVVNHDAPPAPCLHDIRTLFLADPWYEWVQRPFDAALTPAARVENYGQNTCDLSMSCAIYGPGNVLRYQDVLDGGPLNPGVSTLVAFAPWVPTIAERCSVIVRYLAADSIPQNDEKRFAFDIIKGTHTGASAGNYAWTDSDTTDGPIYDWIDTTGAGVAIAAGDEMRIFVPIGFRFPFYDTSFQYLYVSTNGWLALGDDQGVNESLPAILPDINPPNRCLYPWWDNLAVGPGHGGGKVYYRNVGAWPNRRFAVIWQNVNRVGSDTTNLITFEAVLHENGSIAFQYEDVSTGDLTYDNARYACIGVESDFGSDGLCYLYARPPMSTALNDLANRVVSGRAIRLNKIFRDAAALEVVSPADYVFPGNVVPLAKVQNYGTVRDSFWVYMKIKPGYVDSMKIELPPGDSATLTFAPWTATLGYYTALCSTAMTGDVSDSNDVASKIVVCSPWIQRPDVPEGPRRRKVKDPALCYVENQNKLYALKGSNSNTFWVFDIATGEWDSLAPMPHTPSGKRAKDGCALAFDPDHGSEGYLWATKGGGRGDFYAYDIGANLWIEGKKLARLNEYSFRYPKKGAAVAYVSEYGLEGAVYCIPGNNSNYFLRYDVASDSWDRMPDVPIDPENPRRRCKRGSDLVYGDGMIYCLKGSNSWECYGYSPLQNAWVDTFNRTSLMGQRHKKVKSGGSMTYLDSVVYILKGGNTQEFWSYRVGGDTWIQLTDIPFSMQGRRRKVKRGSALEAVDTTIYCIKGSYTYEFWEYKPSGDSTGSFAAASLRRPARQGIMTGLDRHELKPGFAAYPNPTRSGLVIHYAVNSAAHTRILVYDPAGKLVRTLLSSPALPGRHTMRWDGTDNSRRRIPAGVYFVKFESGGTTLTQKIVVQN